MDYPYENLGPERFQEFVQSLINKEFEDVQSFPIAQPDGGRDAISYLNENEDKGFIVYQVKYVRQPLQKEDIHQWLIDILKKEVEKVAKLIPRGAQKYVLITNVKGTAHLDSGAIDRLQKVYDNEIGLPFICWWRDDINRKLDNIWDLKWMYPELMTGPDLIRAIIEKGINNDNIRSTTAIRAFVKDQYERDKELRFKQVDLQNNLLDLYVDVPIISNLNYSTKTRKKSRRTLGYIIKKIIQSDEEAQKYFDNRYLWARHNEDFTSFLDNNSGYSIGAANFFINSEVQRLLPYIVLEGAPGQGKSTVTQYLAQIHRLKILKNSKILNSYQKKTTARIPFKIDLRDFSIWLSKKNPFVIENTESVPSSWQKTLESFLAETVRIYSGGIDFSISDLAAVTQISAILLIFDGLDEVADINKRNEVVEEIIRGVSRLESYAASIQVIITSRPAAFTNSPFFPEESYNYIQLGSVTKKLVSEYTDKWIKARKLNERDAFEVRKVIKDKVDQPHLRELTKNTMQLTILLSLIHAKGVALPDRRTALYDSYIDTFFNRESEKNEFVRDNRELLIDIHRYLAWKLHSDSELNDEHSISISGRITKDNLITLLNDYLANEHYDTSIIEKLFTGMVERVVAIVSRVEGTFEFEVQPLREYFAARYLYDNASPIDGEGTRLERFELISRNFYWLNVSRFYAGCYSRGEIFALVNSLKTLLNDNEYNLISYPLILVSMLIRDWVFSNNPKNLNEVIHLIFNSKQLKVFLDSDRSNQSDNRITISDNKSKAELIKLSFIKLSQLPKVDYAQSLIEIIKSNNHIEFDLINEWQGYFEKDLQNYEFWLYIAVELSILNKINDKYLNDYKDALQLSPKFIYSILRGSKYSYLSSPEIYNYTLDLILNKQVPLSIKTNSTHPIAIIQKILSVNQYGEIFRRPSPKSLSAYYKKAENQEIHSDNLIQDSDIIKLSRVYEKLSKLPSDEWAVSIEPWDKLIEQGRSIWGNKITFYVLANIACNLKMSEKISNEFSKFFESNKSLCKRFLFAKTKTRDFSWWNTQISSIQNNDEKFQFILFVVNWGGYLLISKLIKQIDCFINELPKEHWNSLCEALSEIDVNYYYGGVSTMRVTNEEYKSWDISNKSWYILSNRFKLEINNSIFFNRLINYNGNDDYILRFLEIKALDHVNNETISENMLQIITSVYKIYSFDSPFLIKNYSSRFIYSEIPSNNIVSILESPELYPIYLLKIADKKLKSIFEKNRKPIITLINKKSWVGNF